jgi:hypothetical protein
MGVRTGYLASFFLQHVYPICYWAKTTEHKKEMDNTSPPRFGGVRRDRWACIETALARRRHVGSSQGLPSSEGAQLPALRAALTAHQANHTTKNKLEETLQAA